MTHDGNLTYTELLLLDTKVGILNSFQALGIHVVKSKKKAELAELMNEVFMEKPFYIIDRLPKNEQDILSSLIGCNPSEYIEVPIADERLRLQLHHLVFTEEVNDKWRLYLPDSIRQHIDKSAMGNLAAYPGMQEWKYFMDKLNELQKQIEADVKFNPTVLPIQQLPQYIDRLRKELKMLDEYENNLKKIEKKIQRYNINLSDTYYSIRESRTQCQTTLALMEMFKWG